MSYVKGIESFACIAKILFKSFFKTFPNTKLKKLKKENSMNISKQRIILKIQKVQKVIALLDSLQRKECVSVDLNYVSAPGKNFLSGKFFAFFLE